MFENNPSSLNGPLSGMSLAKINEIIPTFNISNEEFEKINSILTSTPIESERKQ